MSSSIPDPGMVAALIEEAREVLRALGMPREQTNERSALTLLSLLGMKAPQASTWEGKGRGPWATMSPKRLGITQIMDYMRDHFGKRYKPNTRETIRRRTVHQFVQAGLVLQNVDDPHRATNSPDNRYEVESKAIDLLRTWGTQAWEGKLRDYLANVKPLAERYAREREMRTIPLKLPDGTSIALSPGGQNPLVAKIINEFCPRFTPGARPIYVGDTAKKWAFYDEDLLASLGVVIEQHGKMPDVVVFMEDKGWVILIEAVTSHGPMDEKRLIELRRLFDRLEAGLVFVTAFEDRRTLNQFLSEIAWETEVWVADSPTHLIHFNGERFLGPYPD